MNDLIITTADLGVDFVDRVGDTWTILWPTGTERCHWIAIRGRDRRQQTVTREGRCSMGIDTDTDFIHRVVPQVKFRVTSDDVGRLVKHPDGVTVGKIEKVVALINNDDSYCMVRWDTDQPYSQSYNLDGTSVFTNDCVIVGFIDPPAAPPPARTCSI